MDDFFRPPSPRPGLRLHKLEVFNWGTFDSQDGSVYTVRPRGRTSLLVGQNGAGKSTLADALLTLLVKGATRRYNVAAGAGSGRRRDRTERTYIRGAFDHGGNGSGTKLQFLRGGSGIYAAILATFCHEDSPESDFTLAQVLSLNADEKVDKVYAFARGEKSITKDLGGFTSVSRLRQQVEQRGFRATTTFAQYERWFFKAARLRPKAMDIFNQTVAVKDIQSLNDFIRRHMLEKRNWREEIDRILTHFTQLSEAHRLLEQARQQVELLEPVKRAAQRYDAATKALQGLECVKEALPMWFSSRLLATMAPLLEERQVSLKEMKQCQTSLEREMQAQEEAMRHLQNEIDLAGGPRLQQLPNLIRQADALARDKRQASDLFVRFAREAGVAGAQAPREAADFQTLRRQLGGQQTSAAKALPQRELRKADLAVPKYQIHQELEDLRREIGALKQRRNALPERFVEVRHSICHALHLSEKELPFAAELMAVKSEERAWEASIEMVLRHFALSLLVPDRYYPQVSAFVDKTRLVDGRGLGQRLVYLRIGSGVLSGFSGDEPDSSATQDPSRLPGKLAFRAGKKLEPWVRGEVARRFDYLCCQSIETFQKASGDAMTKERHVKSRGQRHEKDDRQRALDRANFVLGWDNKEKLAHLTQVAEKKERQLAEFDREMALLDSALEKLRAQLAAAERALETTSYDAIDYLAEESRVASLRAEEVALRSGSEKLRLLNERLEAAKADRQSASDRRDETIKRLGELERDLDQGRRLMKEAEEDLESWSKAGALEAGKASYDAVATFLGTITPPPDLDHPFGFAEVESHCHRHLDSEIAVARAKAEPLRNGLVERMTRFLRKFDAFGSELLPAPEYASSFISLHDRIVSEDLPGYEDRFKQRLNDKATKEIAILNGELQNEVQEIRSNIRLLNDALRRLAYRAGTHMQLIPQDCQDLEILKFKRQLRDCLSDAFEGSMEADEDRFRRIEKLIIDLRDGDRYRDKVTDVRQWFDFFASEVVDDTGVERSRYSDSSGRSGGEKAKLAFTILAAAIAYQYGIDPNNDTSDSFHFVVVDEMFSKVDDDHALYALELFKTLQLQLLIVSPLDAKARVTEDHVGYYVLVTKDEMTSKSQVFTMTGQRFRALAS